MSEGPFDELPDITPAVGDPVRHDGFEQIQGNWKYCFDLIINLRQAIIYERELFSKSKPPPKLSMLLHDIFLYAVDRTLDYQEINIQL